ncbi:hypothetical protein AVEN_106298-1 [Araneus ventricosus]|uniref:Tc1-like transposase DDE domain-containing protein n=1 Tax=Araneus ventricosus TaxID=182803 RepID=A0A4Y2AS05_ARAVE|nr:hypothetical protein AVEN_106298-1 [Araneus ventricosus]
MSSLLFKTNANFPPSRQHGGGSLPVWGAICFNEQMSLAFLCGRQKSENYQETLANHLLPFGETDWTFREYNASIHASNSTSQRLKSYMSVLNWPAPTENV